MMTATAEMILEQALALPEDERRSLAERLLDTVVQEVPNEVARAWTEEAIQRAGRLERGEVAALDGETAIADLESRLRATREA